MIEQTLQKVKDARLRLNLEYDEMIDLKKYMFKEILKLRTSDEQLITKDCDYVNSLFKLDPHSIDPNKLSDLGQEIIYKVFGGYVSIVSSKQCEEYFTMTKAVYENEIDYKQYECNVMKRMFLKFKMQQDCLTTQSSRDAVKQQFDILQYFGENFFAFKLSENRSLLLVNSFFRFYFDNYADKKKFMDLNIDKYSNIPSFSALAPNSAIFTETRRYKYEIHELDLDTVEFINSLC